MISTQLTDKRQGFFMADTSKINLEKVTSDILETIEREREREIVSRRFGLYDRKETLEQIGELLGITRERVRQLEKVILTRLKAQAEQGKLPHVSEVQETLLAEVSSMGSAARVTDVTAKITSDNSKTNQAKVTFLATLCPEVALVDENDHFYLSVGVKKLHDDKRMRDLTSKIIDAIKKIGEPTSIEEVSKAVSDSDSAHVAALASTSKGLATLNGRWGLIKWPMVNPKNIRDKIYVILYEKGTYMHFNEISEAIKDSDFKRKDVTTQAIHNELIKDKRFVLVGRGIYALKEWGYKKGTVADVITDVLKKADEPLHRDEIVKRVLKDRYVKETTILLNLQGKPQFKRVAKATYTLAN